MPAPPAAVLEAIGSPVTSVLRRVDIYESDASTPWMLDAPLVGGSVSVDMARDERRGGTITLDNSDLGLQSYPRGFWYDKVLKVYRGAYVEGVAWEYQIGELVIDTIDTSRRPRQVSVTCRDYTKKLLTSKFPTTTSFAQGTPLETVIHTIALNAGITKFVLPATGKTLGKAFPFERGVTRWQAVKDLATAYDHEVFMSPTGALILQQPRDPFLAPTVFTFRTGAAGNVSSVGRRTSDTRIYNHIVVTGAKASNGIEVWAEARNEQPMSPTRIAVLGERTYEYVSSFITTEAQAQAVADSFLRIHALEQYELALEALVVPWLEAGEIVEYFDDEAVSGDPTRFLLSNFEIPLGLAAMPLQAKRVTPVG